MERRIISDLSWPVHTSVNSGIHKTLFEGVEVVLSYPTVDNIAELIVRKESGCLIYKRDLKKAYRQFSVDPFDYPLLGFQWEDNFYFDTVLPMELRSAAMPCQRITSAVAFVCRGDGFDVVNYLDDFQGVETPEKATQGYNFLAALLTKLGLQESFAKACPPSTVMTCL